MFKKNDYIVLLNRNCANHKANFCYKQRQNSDHIQPYKDNAGSTTNGSTAFFYKHEENWRYANSQEIAEYDRIGNPYDVTTLITKTLNLELLEEPKSKEAIPEYVKCIEDYSLKTTKGTIYVCLREDEHYIYILNNQGIEDSYVKRCFKPSTKEQYHAQFTPKESPEVLVFGKFKIGSIVVSLTNHSALPRYEGQFFEVRKGSDSTTLYYQEDLSSSRKEAWRAATTEEIKAFESGITNIKDMKKEEEHSFYVKYEPDFTEDIFNKLKEWCNKNIPNIKWYNHVPGDKYADFAFGKYPYFRCFYKQSDKYYCCGVDNNKQDAKKQLSLSELCTLIGYKQEVDKDFKDYSLQGKWVQANHWSSTTFAKCDYFTKGQVYYTECIRDGIYTEVSTWWGNSQEPNRLKEVSLLEIQKYLPEGHVDKIPNTTEEFKVGDWVTITEKPMFWSGAAGGTYPLSGDVKFPFVGKIENLQKDAEYTSCKISSYGFSIEDCDIRKATPEEIAKVQGYKVTDTYFEYKQQPYSEFIKNPEEYPIFAEPKKQKYKFSEVEYLAKPINQQLDLPIVKKYKKKSIINL
jgi:hypothetical protein